MSTNSKEKEETVTQTFAREFYENVVLTMKGKIVNGLKSPDLTPCLIILIVIAILLITLGFFTYELTAKLIDLQDLSIKNILDLFTTPDLLTGTSSQKIEDFKNSCKYVFFIIFILFITLLSIILMNNRRHRGIILAGIVGMIGLVFLMVFYYNNSSTYASRLYTSIVNKVIVFLIFLIIIVTLALSYKLFANRLRNQPGFAGFIIDLIFLIPCLFSDFLEFILRQFKMTSNTVFVLFIIEILLIIGYLTIPSAINATLTKNSVPLLADSVFLMTPQTLTTELLPTSQIDEKTSPNAKYSISMWVYLNQQLHNVDTPTQNIFSYGSDTYGVKPRLAYSNSSSNRTRKDIYQITFSGFSDPSLNPDGEDNTLLLELTGQKWNNFVFNYDGANTVVYVNGEMVRIFKYDSHHPYPTFDSSDVINIGDTNGLDGAICNIVYYNHTLSDTQIRMMYKMLSVHNPPVLSSVSAPSWTPASLAV